MQLAPTSQTIPYAAWEANQKSFEIRRGIPADVESIVTLVNDAYSEKDHGYYRLNGGKGEGRRTTSQDVAKKIEKPHKYTLFVCVNKSKDSPDRVVGTIYLKHHRKTPTDTGNVCMFAVQPEFRSKYQIGSKLMQQIETEAHNNQLSTLELDVVDAIGEHNQQHLIDYYKKNGYRLTGEKVSLMYHTFNQVTTLLMMEKKLTRTC